MSTEHVSCTFSRRKNAKLSRARDQRGPSANATKRLSNRPLNSFSSYRTKQKLTWLTLKIPARYVGQKILVLASPLEKESLRGIRFEPTPHAGGVCSHFELWRPNPQHI